MANALDLVANTLSTHTGILRGITDRLDGGQHKPRGFTGGFDSGPAFLEAIRNMKTRTQEDPRLVNAVSTFGGVGVGADGGYAAAPAWGDEVLTPVVGAGSLLGAFDPVYSPSGHISLAVDDTAEWSSSGVTADLTAEGAAISDSKAVLRGVTVDFYKVPALHHASGEILDDSGAYGRHIWVSLGRKIANRVEQLVVNGTGTGEPLGFMNGPAKITVTPTVSTTSSIGAADVRAMVARLLPGSFGNAIWVASPTAIVGIMEQGGSLYSPDAPTPFGYGRLAGRPVAVSAHMAVFGAAGDIALVDPRAHLFGLIGPRTAATIAFAFDRNLDSFRASVRLGSAPLLAAPIDPLTGTDTLSTTITLGARS